MAGGGAAQTSEGIDRVLSENPLSGLQWRTIILCGIVAMLDGFDTQSVAFVAPVLAEAWGLTPDKIGLIFAGGLLGIMVGQIVLGPLADRFGRRPVIIACTAAFGVCSLATVIADGWISLLFLRFITGVGLGGATPNIIALTAEMSPPARRASIVTTMFAGFPLGAALGGYISSHIIPAYGWQSVFILGGILPLVTLLFLFPMLRESPHYLANNRPGSEILSRIMKTIAGREVELPASDLITGSGPSAGYAALFQGGLGRTTLLLWFAYLNSLLMIYFLMNWLPSTAKASGLNLDTAIVSAVFLNLGGAIGGIILGALGDRFGAFKVLIPGYIIAGFSIAGVGMFAGEAVALMVLVFVAGLFTIGGQTAMNAAAASLYSAKVRATGLGAALAAGRIGSIAGPALGGVLLAQKWDLQLVFLCAAAPAFAVAATVAVLAKKR